MKILFGRGALDENVIDEIHTAVGQYLQRRKSADTRRIEQEVELLKSIVRTSRELAFQLCELTPEVRHFLARDVSAKGFEVLGVAPELWSPKNLLSLVRMLEALGPAAATQVERMPRRGGPGNLRKKLGMGDPLEGFVWAAISIYGRVKGRKSVTKTTPDVDGAGRSCYAFADALHMYATGGPLRHEKVFTRLVAQFNSASSAKPTKRGANSP